MSSFARTFFGWRVVAAAFVVAVFGWGFGFYGPPIFLHAVHDARGWSVGLVSAAVTVHFLFGAVFVVTHPVLQRRLGLPLVTIAGTTLLALGVVGWALAREPWQLFAATVLSGAGWAATGGAAINAMVAPWFARRRPAALAMAYNGASIGGVIFSPVWVAAIAAFGFVTAAVLLGAIMTVAIGVLAQRYFARTPAQMGLAPDGDDAATAAPVMRRPGTVLLSGRSLWASFRFQTLALGTSLGLFAQIGLISHLFSLLVPALGAQGAGFAAALATGCALFGRMGLVAFLPADRRIAGAANYVVQICGCVAFIFAAGTSVPLLLLGVVLFGLGIGNATSLPPLIAQVEFAEQDVPRAVAQNVAVNQATYAFAPAAFGALRELSMDDAWVLFAAAGAVQLLAALSYLAGRR